MKKSFITSGPEHSVNIDYKNWTAGTGKKGYLYTKFGGS